MRKCACGEKATRSLLTKSKTKYKDPEQKQKYWSPVVVRSFCDKCWQRVGKVIYD